MAKNWCRQVGVALRSWKIQWTDPANVTSANIVWHPQFCGQIKRKVDQQNDNRIGKKKGSEAAASSHSQVWTLDEAIKSADGPFDYTNEPSGVAGPGDSLRKSLVVHNLAGNGITIAGDGDYPLTGVDATVRRKVVPGCYELPTGGTDAPPRGRCQSAEIPTGVSLAGSGHSLPPHASEAGVRGHSASKPRHLNGKNGTDDVGEHGRGGTQAPGA